MPQQSKFVCPVCGSNDSIETDDTTPGLYGSWMRRHRRCSKCKCEFETQETVTKIIHDGVPESERVPKQCSCCDRQMRLFVVAVTEGE